MSTEREKMAAGEWYSCMGAELDMLRWHSRRAVHQHNTMPPDERGTIGPLLRALLPPWAKVHSSRRLFIAPTVSTLRSAGMPISMPAAPFSILRRSR